MNNSEALMLLPTIIFLSLGTNIFEFFANHMNMMNFAVHYFFSE